MFHKKSEIIVSFNSLVREIKRIDVNEFLAKSSINVSKEELAVGIDYYTLIGEGLRIIKSLIAMRLHKMDSTVESEAYLLNQIKSNNYSGNPF